MIQTMEVPFTKAKRKDLHWISKSCDTQTGSVDRLIDTLCHKYDLIPYSSYLNPDLGSWSIIIHTFSCGPNEQLISNINLSLSLDCTHQGLQAFFIQRRQRVR